MRLRSLLFVPGDQPNLMAKAVHAGADALILDLEDSVSASRKPAARVAVHSFLTRAARVGPVFVRVNPLRSGLLDEDLRSIEAGRPDGWVLPKTEGAASVLEFARRLESGGIPGAPILPIASETPVAIFKLGEYASVAEHLLGLTWGAEDLSAALGAAAARAADGSYTAPYEMVRSLLLFAAHAAQVAAIETVYPAFRDTEGLARYAARGARDGFTGMMAIHPAQVGIINSAFTPPAQAVERAAHIVAAFADHPDAGVLSIDGAMVDAPHLKQARLLLQRAAADAADTAGAPGCAPPGRPTVK